MKKDRDPEGLAQTCSDPADLAVVVQAIVEADPTIYLVEMVDAIMKHYGGKINPKTVVDHVHRAIDRLTPKQRAGHSADCKMKGCRIAPTCNPPPKERFDLIIDATVSQQQIRVLLDAIQRIQREWSPGRKVSRCDPYTVATNALKVYDEFEELKHTP